MSDYEPTSRRPIANVFRATASVAARLCVRWGIHPDAISYLSILAAIAAAVCFWKSSAHPWLLIVAALLLAVLSAVLWAKWEESRVRAERLQAEIKQVYAETEALRTQAARAQQRVAQLERQLREAPPAQVPAAVVRPKNPRARQ